MATEEKQETQEHLHPGRHRLSEVGLDFSHSVSSASPWRGANILQSMVRERLLDLDAQSCQWQLRRWARAEGAPSGSRARILVMLMARPVGGLAHEAARARAQRGGVGLSLDLGVVCVQGGDLVPGHSSVGPGGTRPPSWQRGGRLSSRQHRRSYHSWS